MRDARGKDPVIGEVIKYVSSGHWPKVGKQETNSKLVALARVRKRLYLDDDDGLLYQKTAIRSQLVLLEKVHSLVFKELHEKMGHLGVDRVLHFIRDQCYWPHMQRDTKH